MVSCNVYYDKEVVPPLKIDSFDEFNVNKWLSLISIITLTTLITFLSSLCRLCDPKNEREAPHANLLEGLIRTLCQCPRN